MASGNNSQAGELGSSPTQLTSSSGKPDTVFLLLQEMLIDVFGTIIPGFCFIVLTVVALSAPFFAARAEICCALQTISLDALSANATVIFATVFLFSFIVGHLLYRQNPKQPDQKSITPCWEDISKRGCVRIRGNECDEFPYGHLKEYLQDRGFDELASLVPWTGADFVEKSDKAPEGNARRRSKHFINAIKMSIKQRDSKLYFDILRNEAHIRLISSVWYGSWALMIVSVIAFIIGAVANLHVGRVLYFEAMALPALIGAAALVTIWSIERSFHYQRVREIVFVLHTWHLINNAGVRVSS